MKYYMPHRTFSIDYSAIWLLMTYISDTVVVNIFLSDSSSVEALLVHDYGLLGDGLAASSLSMMSLM